MNPWLPWDSVLEAPFPYILSYVEDADVMAEIPNPFLLSPCPTVSAMGFAGNGKWASSQGGL